MKILHQGGYSEQERESYREIIWSNTIQSMQVLVRGMKSIDPPIEFDDQSMEVHISFFFFLLLSRQEGAQSNPCFSPTEKG